MAMGPSPWKLLGHFPSVLIAGGMSLRRVAPPEGLGGGVKGRELPATAAPEDSLITGQDLLPASPRGILALSIPSQGLTHLLKILLKFGMPAPSLVAYGFLGLFFEK